MEEKLIIEAMKKAVSRNIRNWDYAAASLLSPWQRRNHQDPALPSAKAGPYFSN